MARNSRFSHSPPNSMVDHLARQLSDKTGTRFTIVRSREAGVLRYGLRAERDDGPGEYVFGRSLKVNEMKLWVASILDMINMGFILAMPKQATLYDVLAIHRQWDAVRTMLILQGEIE